MTPGYKLSGSGWNKAKQEGELEERVFTRNSSLFRLFLARLGSKWMARDSGNQHFGYLENSVDSTEISR
jgi:hypothetical protein